ncbi:UNVERIFIED_CONTAM: hypothetical protein Slati_0126200 [Sesamum latifolium]|uniref:Uncharacterized protein n=1 Tax=Sesamum latifolium TaxID=2727402 RepID=A0AAW2Y964_9LAMI
MAQGYLMELEATLTSQEGGAYQSGGASHSDVLNLRLLGIIYYPPRLSSDQVTAARIGDGCTTKIWIDPWISRFPSFRPRTVISLSPPPTTVCHLFYLASGGWNVPLPSFIFDHADCMAILSLPLSRAPLRDEIIWHFTCSRSFSVKLAMIKLCGMADRAFSMQRF